MSFPHVRTKYFLGFVTGAIISTILVAAILFFADGNRVRGLLTTWRARISASKAPQAAPAVSPPAAVPPPLVSSDLPNGAAAQTATATEPPFVDDHVTRAPESLQPRGPDPGDADLVLAQSYLSGKTGPSGSAAAARFLWAAVEKGNVTAEITLADLYARGDGVTKSCEQAQVLLRAAAGKSSSEASQNLLQIIRRDCR